MRRSIFKKVVLMTSLILSIGLSNSWALTTVTVELRNSSNAIPADAYTAILEYYDGAWITVSEDSYNSGTYTILTERTFLTYRMVYHNGRATKVENTTVSPVVFNTVAVNPSLKDSDGNRLYIEGSVSYNCINYSSTIVGGWTPNTYKELLPGLYNIRMGIYSLSNAPSNEIKTVLIPEGQSVFEVLFTTVTFTAICKDAKGNLVNNGLFTYRHSCWDTKRTPGETVEVLPGTYIVQMNLHNSVKIKQNVVIQGASHTEVFRTSKVKLKLLDCNSKPVTSNASLTHSHIGPCTSCSPNGCIELLPGDQHSFTMFFNKLVVGKQTLIIPNDSVEVFFTAPNGIETFVWHDINKDGCQTGEQNLGIRGVQVDLIKPNGTILATTYTNYDGRAHFNNIPLYQPVKLKYHLPNGYKFTRRRGWKYNPNNNDANRRGKTPVFFVADDGFITYIDAGLKLKKQPSSCHKQDEELNTISSTTIYPNPASERLTVSYDLDTEQKVKITIYDLSGKEVAVLCNHIQQAGNHKVEWQIPELTSGLYLCQIIRNDETEVLKLIIQK